MMDEFIPEGTVSKDRLPLVARFKCSQCGAYGLNRPIECTGFGGDPGDDSMAHSPLMMANNPDKES